MSTSLYGRSGRVSSQRKRRSLFAALLIASACSGIPDRPALRDDVNSLGPGGQGGSHSGASQGAAPAAGEAGTPGPAGAGGEAGTPGSGGAGGERAPEPEPACGDEELNEGEECDDGNAVAGDGCDRDCVIEPAPPACGDGVVKDSEACDDGNLTPGDGCDSRCRRERCGNRRRDVGEECDPPDLIKCDIACLRRGPHCGDGVLHPDEGEECDDANIVPGDGCHSCRIQCGDGKIDRTIGEQCEPAYSLPGRCSEDCRYVAVCGDGEVQPEAGEECDPSDGVECFNCLFTDQGGGGAGGGGNEGGQGGEGGPGADCVPMATGERVVNGTFEVDFNGWQPHDATLASLRLVDEGKPNPRALEVTLASSPTAAVSGAYQCVPVQSGQSYIASADYFIANDAPIGVGASISAFLYAGTSCTGSIVGTPVAGSVGLTRGVWAKTSRTVDTSALPEGEGRVLLRLDVVRPADVANSRVIWDSVSLAPPGGMCGNCRVDSGEQCDDGNRTAGDGCNETCQLVICGDRRVELPEECDDGNTQFEIGVDACTPSCRTPNDCDTCAADDCPVDAAFCLNLTRRTEAGPRTKVPQSTLCDELRTCVHESGCNQVERTFGGQARAALENCYCGTAGAACFLASGAANGSCRAEVEAALETTDPAALLGRFDGADPRYPVFAALRDLLACEKTECNSGCVIPLSCGNGSVQDRDPQNPLQLEINGQLVPCRDELTHTGRGCSFEECDDGNTTLGDGCDDQCFVEACGNSVKQFGEECDDGNATAGDGCGPDCQAEFHCGNSIVEPVGENCDPPAPGPVCTQQQFDANPAQCGCDGRCQRIVCGNGGPVQPGEECDPPNGFSCDDQCQLIGESACEACINAIPDSVVPDLARLNATECNTDPECVAVKQCVVASGCLAPPLGSVNSCYCGPIADERCAAPNFQPTGPCHDEIVAGIGGTPSNAEVVDFFLSDLSNSSGLGVLIVSVALVTECSDECNPSSIAE